MRSSAIAFLLGILCCIAMPNLPSIKWLFAFLFCLPFFIFILVKKNNFLFKFIFLFFMGFFYLFWRSYLVLDWQLPKSLETKTITITGYVIDLPIQTEQQTSFIFLLKKINQKNISTKIKLSWRNAPLLHVGDQWQLNVRLKRIHALMNPGSNDYAAIAFLQAIRAKGYVFNSTENHFLNHSNWVSPLNQLREWMKYKIQASFLPTLQESGSILALAIGDRSLLTSAQWQIMRNTGTNHLMAIAGLHLGFIAGLFFWLGTKIWRQWPRACLTYPAEQMGAIFSLIIAGLYAALSGFALPAQRGYIMLLVFLIALILRRKLAAWQGYFLALWIVLLIDPLCVLSSSFWLSFISVALIIFAMRHIDLGKKRFFHLIYMQFVIALGLIPLTIVLFQQYTLLGFFANAISVPWVGFIILPLIFLSVLSALFSVKIAGLFFWLADKNLIGLWWILNKISIFPCAVVIQTEQNKIVVLFAVLGIILFLYFKKYFLKCSSLLFCFPLLFFSPNTLKKGQVKLTVLDVGQGLATVVQTKQHILIFDAGPKFGKNYDIGESVVTPFLHILHVKKIDLLVLSHGDNDHVGGARALTKNFIVKKIQSGEPARLKFLPNVLSCWRGEQWQWDNVNFAFLFPEKNSLLKSNDHSCVLKITTQNKQSILLTGDIEKQAENFLLHSSQSLATTILIAPHHGSKTSGLNAFIQAVHPEWVIFSIGYLNRFHFPHPDIVKKYQNLNAHIFSTEKSGALSFLLDANQKEVRVTSYRATHQHFWQD